MSYHPYQDLLVAAILEIQDDDDFLLEGIEDADGGENVADFTETDLQATKRRHACWVRDWIMARYDKEHNTLYDLRNELIALADAKEFRAMMRMSHEVYTILLERLSPRITKQDTHMRSAIPPDFRLSVFLKFMATGDNYISLSQYFRIGRTTARTIVLDTADAVWDVLQPQYLKTPTTEKEWLDVSEGFRSRWQFPNCLGALDGKHVEIAPPPSAGSDYYCYKGYNSIILMALCDSNYQLLYVDVGAEGRAGDAGTWNACSLNLALNSGNLNIPVGAALPGTDLQMPFVIVGDEAFRMTPNLLKPYSRTSMLLHEKVFNYRISRARRLSENVFGIIVNRFGCLRKSLCMRPDFATKIVLAACCLHNFLRVHEGENYIHPVADKSTWDMETSEVDLESMYKDCARNPSVMAKTVRNTFADYFTSRIGSVHWQWKKIDEVCPYSSDEETE